MPASSRSGLSLTSRSGGGEGWERGVLVRLRGGFDQMMYFSFRRGPSPEPGEFSLCNALDAAAVDTYFQDLWALGARVAVRRGYLHCLVSRNPTCPGLLQATSNSCEINTTRAKTHAHTTMDRQVPFGILLQELGGEKRSPAMDAHQGLQTPIALRPPPQVGKSPLESGFSQPRMELSIGGGSPAAAPAAPAGASSEPPLKRKRGRPRKYTGENSSPGAHASGSSGATESLFSALAKKIAAPYTPPPDKSEKRGRGRPIGSTKKQQLANLGVVLAGSGKSFTPHILTVNTGEDVSSKIMQFAQHGPRAMCVLSANGAVSNVMLRQESSSGGTVTYEGRYEILSLSGSYLPTEGGDGAKSRTGSISVSLAGSDGRVFGGGVAGMLMAASPIQLVVGSFLVGSSKPDAKVDSPLHLTQGETSGVATPSGAQQQQQPGPKNELRGSGFTPPSLNGAGARPQNGGPQAPSGSGQPSEPRPQAIGVFQPPEGWGIAPHVPFSSDNRRADINIPLAGG